MAKTIVFCLEIGRFPDNREHRSGFTPGHSEDGEDEGRRWRKEGGDEVGEGEEEVEEEASKSKCHANPFLTIYN